MRREEFFKWFAAQQQRWLIQMFPQIFRGHRFSVFRIIGQIFSASSHSSPNLWSESPGPGTPWWRPFACAPHMPHFLFSLSSCCNRYKQSRIWQLEGMLQTIVKAVTLHLRPICSFSFAQISDIISYAMLKVGQGLSSYKCRRKGTWLLCSLAISSWLGLCRS